MSNNKTNILLVENQTLQYRAIYNCFNQEDLNFSFKIIPDNDHFTEFIDCVRVWVNKNYGDYNNKNLIKSDKDLCYRELAMKKIIQTISDYNIDIILMDYKLGAGYLSKTGIDLATEINNIREILNFQVLPVVFISKDQSNEKIEKELKKYKWRKSWIIKGFFGDEILRPKFIEDYVVNGENGIVKLLANTKDIPQENSIEETSI